jgi:hypothetical protein
MKWAAVMAPSGMSLAVSIASRGFTGPSSGDRKQSCGKSWSQTTGCPKRQPEILWSIPLTTDRHDRNYRSDHKSNSPGVVPWLCAVGNDDRLGGTNGVFGSSNRRTVEAEIIDTV